MGGPIRIAKISGQVAEFGLMAFISMMAYISISLGLILIKLDSERAGQKK